MKNQLSSKNKKATKVFYSEKLRVFYLKNEKIHFPNDNFQYLITCKEELFNDFLTHLAKFTTAENPKSYTFTELKDKLNKFLIKRANNCKVIGSNIEINKAS